MSAVRKIKAPAAPPAREITIEEKRAVRLDSAMWELQDAVEDAQKKIARFQEMVSLHGLAYAMEWEGETAMRAEVCGNKVYRIFAFVMTSDLPAADKIKILEERRAEFLDSLVGGQWTASSPGPWAHRSTSGMSNMLALVTCDADRYMYGLLSRLIRKLSFAWGLVDEVAP